MDAKHTGLCIAADLRLVMLHPSSTARALDIHARARDQQVSWWLALRLWSVEKQGTLSLMSRFWLRCARVHADFDSRGAFLLAARINA